MSATGTAKVTATCCVLPARDYTRRAILYATRLAGLLLGLVFDAETPFGTIRSQAGKLGALLDQRRTHPPIEVVSTTPLTWTAVAAPPAPTQPEMNDEDDEDIASPRSRTFCTMSVA